MNGSEGSLHLATCWTWPSSSIEIGRRPAPRSMLSELYASGSPAASLLDVIVTHLLNKLCSELEKEGLKDPCEGLATQKKLSSRIYRRSI